MEFTLRDCIFGLVGVSVMWFVDSVLLRPKGINVNMWLFAIFGAAIGILMSKIYTNFANHAVRETEGGK